MTVPALAGAGLAFGALKMSLSGMGAAINAADPTELADALAELPPSAQSAALAMRDLKQGFQGLTDQVKAGFWDAIDPSRFSQLSTFIEPIGTAMTHIASTAGQAADGVLAFANSSTGMSAVSQLLAGGSVAAGNLLSAVLKLVPGITSVGAAASPILARLTGSINEAAQAWSDKMVAGFESGDLTAKFEGIVNSAKQLGTVFGQIGGIISGVWSAMNAAGQPFLGTIGQVIESTNEWVNSAQGMSTLTSFFSSMSTAVGAVLPILGQLAGIIGGTVAPAIAGLVETLAPAISTLVDGLGQGLAAIAPAVQPLGDAFGQVLSAVAPVLPVVGELIASLAGALTPVISALAPVISSLAGVFQTLAPVIGTIAGVLGGVLATAITAVAPLFDTLGQVAQMLAPVLEQVATTLGGVLTQAITAIAPFIPQLAQAFMQILQAVLPLVPIIVDLAATIIGALLPVIVALMPTIIALIQVFANIVTAIMPVIQIIAQVIAVFAQLLGAILGFVASALGMIVSFVAGVISGFVSMCATVIGAIAGFVSGILGFIANLVSSFISFVTNLWSTVVSAFSSGVSNAVSTVGELPGKILGVLGNLGSLLIDSGKALIQGFIDGIKSMFGAVTDAASNIVGAVRDFFPFSPAKRGPFSGHGWVLYSGRSIGTAFAQGIQERAGLALAASESMMNATSKTLSGYRTDLTATGAPGSGGAAVDTSIHIGTLVAADPKKPMRDAAELQLKAQIRGGTR